MLSLATVVAIGAVCGCEGPQKTAGPGPSPAPAAAGKPPAANPNVVGVQAFYDPYNPWLWNENRTKPIGIVVQALYLAGPQSKGVFGDGVIRPRLFVKYINVEGNIDWKPVKEWRFSSEESVLFRSKRETMLGWGYRLHLPFENADLGGREIRMIVEYERSDGRVVSSSSKDFKVPGASRKN